MGNEKLSKSFHKLSQMLLYFIQLLVKIVVFKDEGENTQTAMIVDQIMG